MTKEEVKVILRRKSSTGKEISAAFSEYFKGVSNPMGVKRDLVAELNVPLFTNE